MLLIQRLQLVFIKWLMLQDDYLINPTDGICSKPDRISLERKCNPYMGKMKIERSQQLLSRISNYLTEMITMTVRILCN